MSDDTVLAGEKLPDTASSARRVLAAMVGRVSLKGVRIERVAPGRYKASGPKLRARIVLAGYGPTKFNDATVRWIR